MNQIALGDKVKDKVTGFTGTVIAYTNYLYSNNSFTVAPSVDKEGKFIDVLEFNEGRLEKVIEEI